MIKPKQNNVFPSQFIKGTYFSAMRLGFYLTILPPTCGGVRRDSYILHVDAKFMDPSISVGPALLARR